MMKAHFDLSHSELKTLLVREKLMIMEIQVMYLFKIYCSYSLKK